MIHAVLASIWRSRRSRWRLSDLEDSLLGDVLIGLGVGVVFVGGMFILMFVL